jgi:hypothetical protein
MFFFRINKMKVIDSRTSAFLYFREDLASAFVPIGNVPLHTLDPCVRETDPDKKTFFAAVASNALASRILTEIENAKNNPAFLLRGAGYVLFHSARIPDDFNWSLFSAKSNQERRQLAELIGGVLEDPEFDTFAGNLATLVAGTASPAFLAGVGLMKFATRTISKILAAKGDEPVDVLYTSLDRAEHYLFGEDHKECA